MSEATDLTIVETNPAPLPTTELGPIGGPLTVGQITQRYGMLAHFKDAILRDGVDYGVIPGTGSRPTLMQPGAQKLCVLFGVSPSFEIVERAEDWTGDEHGGEPFFRYLIKCRLVNLDGTQVSESHGEINSWESKYRYRWVYANQVPGDIDPESLPKNRYGKYRVPNDDIYSQINTLIKMGQKRALVGAALNLGASEFFTQDVEDFANGVIDTSYRDATPPAPPIPPVSTTPAGPHTLTKTEAESLVRYGWDTYNMENREFSQALGVDRLTAFEGDLAAAKAKLDEYMEAIMDSEPATAKGDPLTEEAEDLGGELAHWSDDDKAVDAVHEFAEELLLTNDQKWQALTQWNEAHGGGNVSKLTDFTGTRSDATDAILEFKANLDHASKAAELPGMPEEEAEVPYGR